MEPGMTTIEKRFLDVPMTVLAMILGAVGGKIELSETQYLGMREHINSGDMDIDIGLPENDAPAQERKYTLRLIKGIPRVS